MAAQRALDEAKVEAFMEKALGDISGMMACGLCHLGDRLGLFGELAATGPAGSRELADRLDLNERYVREWLRGLTAAGYLEEPEPGRFTLPPEHAPALADESGPMFLGGVYQMMPAALAPYERLIEAFRTGGGVRQSDYPDILWDGMSRFTGSWFESAMVDDWLSTFPHVVAGLERGIEVADVGCGAGRALIVLAERFPRSRFTGFDNFPAQLERARANAEEAGVADRVTFETADAAQGLPGRYDLVTTFDVIHDAVDPKRLLAAIRAAVKDDGDYLMLEVNCKDRPEDNVGPVASMFYGFSMFYCMTTSLANGGAALGTCGMPEAVVRDLCVEAGFSDVVRSTADDPFNVLYDVKP
ncbi:methyltransferase domain-containing protein [Streptomyces sp. TRM S81-3]|uniref:Methyltransferase domain-containing protein n=1 Tax=Streptomyces griseicoloratus TaxID=2752516 RepID=A0A926L5I7_9ACTN|nr:class I SAM-dependent methyltransferase [Streptomyces griseicoloratus]MBD0421799.1 methyltransferase domain-containing protein [Streptomyces griseicoloratus]